MTAIQWTEQTWNPIIGCRRHSPGCENCYAEKMTKRLAAMGQEKYIGLLDDHNRFNGVIRFHPDALDIPRKRKKPTMWFVNSMSDLFHKDVATAYLYAIWKVMADTPQHTYQILTKRADLLPARVGAMVNAFGILPNVWIGVSVEDQKRADERIPHLLKTAAPVRFLSCEPLLGPVVLPSPLHEPHWTVADIDWVIIGGESGAKARVFRLEWAENIIEQCQAAGVPVFMKQLGSNAWMDGRYETTDRKGGDMAEWPEKLRIREFPQIAMEASE